MQVKSVYNALKHFDPTANLDASASEGPQRDENDYKLARRQLKTILAKMRSKSLRYVLDDVWPDFRLAHGWKVQKNDVVIALIEWVSGCSNTCTDSGIHCWFSARNNPMERRPPVLALTNCWEEFKT